MTISKHAQFSVLAFVFIVCWASAFEQDCPFFTFDATSMTRKELYDHCFSPQQPCIIKNALHIFPAFTRWRERKFVEQYGQVNISYADRGAIVLTAGGYSTSIEPLAEFFSTKTHRDAVFTFFKDIKESNRVNSKLFDSLNDDTKTELLHELLLEFFPSQAYFYTTKFLSLGNKGSGIDFHYHGDTLLALIKGKKTWYIYEPGSMPSKVSKKIDVVHGNWKNISLSKKLKAEEKPLVCVQHPGTVLYLPQMYHHCTENNDDTVGVGWQLDTQRDMAIATANSILEKNPNNALAQFTLNWFTYETAPEKWISTYNSKPLDLKFAQEALNSVCQAGRELKKGRKIMRFWESKMDILKKTKKGRNRKGIRIRVFLLTLSHVIHMMFNFRHCLDISLERIKYMIKLMSMIDTTRSMTITQQYYSGKISSGEEMDEELRSIVEESKREFMDHLYL